MRNRVTLGICFCRVIMDKCEEMYKIHVELSNCHKDFEIPIKSSDSVKEQSVGNIREFLYKNKNKNSKADPEYFLQVHEKDIRKFIRIHDWKTLKDLETERDKCIDGIDKFTQYIDSLAQEKEAEARNDELRKSISLYNKVIKQLQEVMVKYRNNDVTYSYGLFRINMSGDYKYEKFNK